MSYRPQYYSPDLKEVVHRVKFPPILTPRECLDSTITCRVCWNGFASQGVVFLRRGNIPELFTCPECHGTKEMKSTTKEEKYLMKKQIRDENVGRPIVE